MAASDNIIAWNAANWITVILMVMGGFALIALGAQLWNNRNAATS